MMMTQALNITLKDKPRILYNILVISDEGRPLLYIHQSRQRNNIVMNLKELDVKIRAGVFLLRLRTSGMSL
jgi:hypothetical protein